MDLEIFFKLMCFDSAGMWKRRLGGLKEISPKLQGLGRAYGIADDEALPVKRLPGAASYDRIAGYSCFMGSANDRMSGSRPC